MSSVHYIDRKNTNSIKWDVLHAMYGQDDLLAMWVADMDFQAPQCVIDALSEYVNEGVFGYYRPSDEYYEAFIAWEKKHHGYEVHRDWIRFSPGVVTGFNWIVQFMTKPGDAVIVTTPVYYPFMNAVTDNERKLVTSDLINHNGLYTIDFVDFEQKIIENQVRLFILCSPHNPVGRVWTREELKTVLDICRKHKVFVISDEIHHDLVYGNNRHTPSFTVGNYDDMMIMLTAPSKTFNLASCQNSVIVIPNETLRKRWDEHAQACHVTSGNAFGYVAATAAYTGGAGWLKEINEMIYSNYKYAKDFLNTNLPNAIVSPLEGTYLVWIDMKNYLSADELKGFMQERCKLAFDYGDWFGGERFGTFIRMNIATSRENVTIALTRILENSSQMKYNMHNIL